MTDVAINQNATRLLWEGTNPKGEIRKVYYVEYVDGFHILLLTDADDNTVDHTTAGRICNRFLPWKYEPEQDDHKYKPMADFGE